MAKRSTLRLEVWIPVAYAFLAAGWIAFSDVLVAAASNSAGEQMAWSIVKGWGFVVVTTTALHFGMRWALGRERSARQVAEAREEALRASELTLRQSEERFQAIFEQAAVGMAQVDARTGRFLRVNEKLCEIVGYSRDEVLQITWRDLTHPDDLPFDEESYRRMLLCHASYSKEKRYIRKDGRLVWINLAVAPMWTDGSEPTSQVSVMEDITDRKRAEEALRESERRYHLFFQNIREGATIHELVRGEHGEIVDLKVADANPEAVRSLRKPLDEIRKGLASRLYGADALSYLHLVRSAMAGTTSGGPDQALDVKLASSGRHYRMAAFALDEGTVVVTGIDVTDRWSAERALRESEGRLRALMEKSTDLIVVLDAEGCYRFWSPSAAEALGYTEEEKLGRLAFDFVHADDRPRVVEAFRTLLSAPGTTARLSFRYRHKGGAFRLLEANARNWIADPAVRGVVVNNRDVTEQRTLEEQFRQAQKLESVGRLAGGVAHDFNNVLTVILGCVEELQEDARQGRPVNLEEIEDIRAAGERARDLTRQLLAFARKQVIAPVPLDLNLLVRNAEKLLRRILGEDIELVTVLQPNLGIVRCDPGQMEQVVLNLAVNARDAMASGGTLTIETSDVDVDERQTAAHPWMREGPCVRLVLRDSGHGMSPEVMAHVFEPFFTTKPKGQGTGLGLATVYGIVKQSGGFVLVESEAGQGTTFALYFPLTRDALPASTVKEPAVAPQGTETILLAEDDPQVREVAARALRAGGYRVFAACDGREALDLGAREQGRLHLLVTDVVMPGLDGREVAQLLRRRHPEMRVLYFSGHAEETISKRGVLEPGIDFLEKPFTASTLLARVRTLLDARQSGG